MRIGKTIRKLRLKAGLTQEELANRADLTKGFISQVENDATSPSIATLNDIVSALGVSLCDFFRNEEGPKKVVYGREDWIVSGDSSGGYKLVFLVPRAHLNKMELVVVSLEPGQETPIDQGHEGEEFGYVLSGQVSVSLGSEKFKVKKGECFHYAADTVHKLTCGGKRRATLLWASCPPSF